MTKRISCRIVQSRPASPSEALIKQPYVKPADSFGNRSDYRQSAKPSFAVFRMIYPQQKPNYPLGMWMDFVA